MTLGQKLKALRQSRFLSQQKVADGVGLSQSAIASYEVDVREPDFATIKKLADFFGVSASSLMPSDDDTDRELIQQVADSLHKNPKLRLLFDRSMYLTEKDLDAVLAVVSAISKERGDD